jgi:hypothetical protein
MSRKPGSRTERLITGRMTEPTWALTDEQWIRVAKAYSRDFEIAVIANTDEAAMWRAEIEAINRDLIMEISIEQTAPAKADAVKFLHNIHYYASELAKAIEGVKIDPLARSMARGDLDGQLLLRDFGASVDGEDAPPAMPIKSFAAHVHDVAQAADIAWREMQDEVATTPGDARDRWTTRLTAFCERNSFPVSVSDESDFVSFITALQSTLPAWVKPQVRNAGAMARAIERARDAVEDRIAAQKNRSDEAVIEMRERARRRHARRLDRANRRQRWRLGRSVRRSARRAAQQQVDI